jgi:hypothetical protein
MTSVLLARHTRSPIKHSPANLPSPPKLLPSLVHEVQLELGGAQQHDLSACHNRTGPSSVLQ